MVLIATLNNADAAITGPAGWTLVDSVSSTTNTMQSAVWTKVATAADAGSSIRVTNSVTSKSSLSLYAYAGAGGISAIARAVESVASTSHTSPTVAVSTPGSTLLSYWADKSSDNTGWALPVGVVARTQSVGTSSGRIVSAAGDSGSLGIGSVGGVAATAAGVANKRAVSWSIVVAPPT